MTDRDEPAGREQQGAGAPYEPMPSAPALNERGPSTGPTAERPRSVTMSFILWLVMGAVLLISAVLVLVAGDDAFDDAARTALEAQNKPNPTDQEVQDTITFIRVFGAGIPLLFTVLTLVFALPMRGGRNWGRIGLAVTGGLLLVLSFLGGGTNLLFTVLELVIIATAVYFMFRPDANQFFAAAKARPR